MTKVKYTNASPGNSKPLLALSLRVRGRVDRPARAASAKTPPDGGLLLVFDAEVGSSSRHVIQEPGCLGPFDPCRGNFLSISFLLRIVSRLLQQRLLVDFPLQFLRVAASV